jgi:hypothetical protein
MLMAPMVTQRLGNDFNGATCESVMLASVSYHDVRRAEIATLGSQTKFDGFTIR